MIEKTFEQLKNENANCLEYILNGYIRIYEKGEKPCECKDCKFIRDNDSFKK